MATITKVIDVCDRCSFGKAPEATEERIFSIDGSFYKLKLCGSHATMFDREISGWTRLAEDIDPPIEGRHRSEYFIAERRAETQRLRELADRAAEKARAEAAAAARLAEIEAAEKAAAEAAERAQAARTAEQRRLERAEQAQKVQEIRRNARDADQPEPGQPTVEELRAQQEREAWELVPNAPGWRLTSHARERMWERGYTPAQVLNAAANPEIVRANYQSIGMPYRKGLSLHERGDCKVVVNEEKKSVITVMERDLNAQPYESSTERKAQ